MTAEARWVDGDEMIATIEVGGAKVTIGTSRSRASRALIIGVRLPNSAERTTFIGARQLDAFLDAVLEVRRRVRSRWPTDCGKPWGTFAGPRRTRSGVSTTDEACDEREDAHGAAQGEEKPFRSEGR